MIGSDQRQISNSPGIGGATVISSSSSTNPAQGESSYLGWAVSSFKKFYKAEGQSTPGPVSGSISADSSTPATALSATNAPSAANSKPSTVTTPSKSGGVASPKADTLEDQEREKQIVDLVVKMGYSRAKVKSMIQRKKDNDEDFDFESIVEELGNQASSAGNNSANKAAPSFSSKPFEGSSASKYSYKDEEEESGMGDDAGDVGGDNDDGWDWDNEFEQANKISSASSTPKSSASTSSASVSFGAKSVQQIATPVSQQKPAIPTQQASRAASKQEPADDDDGWDFEEYTELAALPSAPASSSASKKLSNAGDEFVQQAKPLKAATTTPINISATIHPTSHHHQSINNGSFSSTSNSKSTKATPKNEDDDWGEW